MAMWHKIAKAIRNNFLTGLLVVTPVVATILIVNFLFTFSTNYLVPKKWLQGGNALQYRLLALAIVVAGIFLVGLLVRNYVGRSLYQLTDRLLRRLPFVKTIYLSVRQISETIFASQNMMFKEPMLVEFPKSGVYALCFVMSRLPQRLQTDFNKKGLAGEWAAVFVPTAPNPTSGFVIFAPNTALIPLEISSADAMKMIISVGTLMPGAAVEDANLLMRFRKTGGKGNAAPPGPADGSASEPAQTQ